MSDPFKSNLPQATEQKKLNVAQKSQQMHLESADANALLAGAVAMENGNQLAEAEIYRDMQTLHPLDFETKWGKVATQQAGRMAFDRMAVDRQLNSERSGGEIAKDTGLVAADALTSLVGNTASLGALVPDAVFGTDLSVAVNELTSDASRWLNDQKSDQIKNRRQIHNTQHNLNTQDSAAQYEADVAEGDDGWGSWVRKQGRDFGNVVANYADDPAMAAEAAIQGASYVIPFAGAARVAGTAKAAAQIAKTKGISKAAAKKLIKENPAQYADLVNKMATKSVPAISAVMEAGGTVSQAQMDVLTMDIEEMSDVPAFQRLLQEGFSPEEAQVRMARNAGMAAAPLGAAAGYAVGKVAPGFEANPLRNGASRSGVGSSLGKSAGTVAVETGEETVQEGLNQLSVNAAKKLIGLDTDLSEGVAAASAEGAVGGFGTAAGLQAPGAAAGTAKELVKPAIDEIKEGINSAGARQEEKIAAENPDGVVAKGTAAKAFVENLETLAEQEATTITTEEGSGTEAPADESSVREAVIDAAMVPDTEAEDFAGFHPALKEMLDRNGRLDRFSVIKALRSTMAQEGVDDTTKRNLGVVALRMRDELGKALNDTLTERTDALEDGDTKALVSSIQADLKQVMDAGDMKNAEQVVSELSSEEAHSIVDGLQGSEQVSTMATLARYNPDLFATSDYDTVLNQSDIDADDRSTLEAGREIAKDKAEHLKTVTNIAEVHAAADAALKGTKPKGKVSADEVAKQIAKTGNKNNDLPSVFQHSVGFQQAMQRGDTAAALSALGRLQGFATGLSNKYAALTQAYDQGSSKPVPFQNYNGKEFYKDSGKNKTVFHPSNKSSAAYAMRVHADAQLATQIHNNLVKTYGGKLKEMFDGFDHELITLGTANDGIADVLGTPLAETKVEPEPEVEQTKELKVEPVAEATPVEEVPAKEGAHTGVNDLTTNDPAVGDATRSRTSLTGLFKNLPFALKPEATKTGVKARNMFLQAFKRRKDGSQLVTYSDPVQFLTDNIDRLEEISKTEIDEKFSTDQRKALSGFLSRVVPAWADALDDHVNKLMQSEAKKGGDLRKDLLNRDDYGPQMLSNKNARLANFIVEKEDGTYGIDPRVAQASALATLQWALESNSRGKPKMQSKQVAKILGLPEGTLVSSEAIVALNSGFYAPLAYEAIGKTTMTLLGVTPTGDAEGTFTDALFPALSAEMIEMVVNHGPASLVQRNMHEKINVLVDGGKMFRSFEMLALNENSAKFLDTLSTTPDVFTRVFVAGANKMRHIGKPTTTPATHIIRNPNNKNSTNQAKVIKNRNETPYLMNQDPLKALNVLGKDVALTIFGHKGKPDTSRMHKDQVESINGKNRALERQWDGIVQYQKAIKAYADKEGMPAADVPVFFEHQFSSVGRLQQQGPLTPQADKIFRMIASPNQSVLDLSGSQDAVSERNVDADGNAVLSDLDAFYVMAAQALGVKLHKQPSIAHMVTAAKDIIHETETQALIAHLRTVVQSAGTPDKEIAVKVKEAAEAWEAKGHEMEEVTFQALLELARLEEARKAGGKALTEFKTGLYVESDGISDGPFNALVHNLTGEFTADQLQNMARGGLIFGEIAGSINEFNQTDAGQQDLYEAAKERMMELIRGSVVASGDNPAGLPVFRVMSEFGKGFTFTENSDVDLIEDEGDETDSPETYEFEGDRKITKNPMTQVTYGAGPNGVAKGLTAGVVRKLQDTLVEVVVGIKEGTLKGLNEHPVFAPYATGASSNQLVDDLNAMMSQRKTPEGMKPVKDPTTVQAMFADALNSRVSKQSFQAINDHLVEHYVSPMIQGVDDVAGGIRKEMAHTQGVANALTSLFSAKLQAVIEQKKTELGLAQDASLSKNQMKEVFDVASKLLPIFKGGDQTFQVSHAEEKVLSGKDGKAGTLLWGSKNVVRGKGIAASDAGVKISPYTVIGMGDGQMIINVYLDEAGNVDKSLMVFDGINVGADNMVAGSSVINKATFDAMMSGNIHEMIYETARRVAAAGKDLETDPDVLTALAEIADRSDVDFTKGVSESWVENMVQSMEEKALSVRARKTVMQKFPAAADHMSLIMQAHINPGSIKEIQGIDGETKVLGKDDVSFQDLAHAMNTEYQVELGRLQKEAKSVDKETVVAKADPKVLDAAKSTHLNPSEAADETGVVMVKSGYARQFLKNLLPALPKESQKVARSLLSKKNALLDNLDDVTMYLGDKAPLMKLRNSQENISKQDRKGMGSGQYMPATHRIYISNSSPETALHELLHAATYSQLKAVTESPETAPLVARNTLDRLRTLRADVEALDVSVYGSPSQKAHAALIRAMAALDKHGDEAGALSELISWGLANQHLQKVLGDQKASPAARVARKLMAVIKRLFGISSDAGDTILSNLRFNTEIISQIQAQAPAYAGIATILRQEDPDLDGHGNLDALESQYLDALRLHLDMLEPDEVLRKADSDGRLDDAIRKTRDAEALATAARFDMSARRSAVFKAMYAAISSGMQMNSASVRHGYKVMEHVLDKLSVADLVAQGDSTVDATDKLAYLNGSLGLRGDIGKRDQLAAFLSLSQIDNPLRKAMGQLEMPKDIQKTGEGFDGLVRSVVNSASNVLVSTAAGISVKDHNVRSQLDVVSKTLSNIVDERDQHAMDKALNIIDPLNDVVADKVQKIGDASEAYLTKKGDEAKNETLKAGFRIGAFVSSMIGSTGGDAAGRALTDLVNKFDGLHTMRAVVRDIVGENDGNTGFYRLINNTRSRAERVRQLFRSDVPKNIRTEFSRELSKDEWAHLHKGLARTDIMSMGLSGSVEVLEDIDNIDAHIGATEEALLEHGGKRYFDLYKKKADELAHYMVQRKPKAQMTLRNSEAIARLLGHGYGIDEVSPELVKAISELTTLYALKGLDADTVATLKTILKEETAGLKAVTAMLHNIRKEEHNKHYEVSGIADRTNIGLYNGWKGYAPTQVKGGHQVIIARDAEDHDRLVSMGYTRIGDAATSRYEEYTGKMGYYQTRTGGRSAFRQGGIQTINTTFMGVSSKTGLTHNHLTADAIMGSDAKAIHKRIVRDKRAKKVEELLLPVFGDEGQIIGFERPVDPGMLGSLRESEDLADMLGVWMGRVVEEREAQELNSTFVAAAKTMYDEGLKDGADFINVADPTLKDETIKYAWKNLGWEVKAEIEAHFGKEGFFPVRKDQIDVALGFPRASATDAWTGTSRWNKETQDLFRRTMMMIGGRKAYGFLKDAEKVQQGLVGYAKTNLLVRYGIVWMGNEMSNTLHGLAWGIGPAQQWKLKREAFIEISQYRENEIKLNQLQSKLAAEKLDTPEAKRLTARMQAVKEAQSRLNIAPLIEMGEFNTVVEDMSDADEALLDGRLGEFIEEQIETHIPDGVREFGRQVQMSKDTAIFQAMNRAVQYSDFLSKYALYKHLMAQGKDRDYIEQTIRNEYVNYNLPAGRGRDYLEAMGLVWFHNYKLRILKVMFSMMRNRPVSALLTMGGAGPVTGVDTVASGSLAGSLINGNYGYLWGVDMQLNNLVANPIAAEIL